MGYQASLDYLYSLQRFGIKLGLENTARLLDRLGNPQNDLRIVHIAGTNGKGSTASALTSILRQAGLRVGLYTSPHLHSFTERVQVDGKAIAEQTVAELIEEIRPVAIELGTTFFEFATVLALLCFQRSGVEWAVLEVGMGGRLDATNVVTPELALVTPISLDHAEHLGSTLAEVAGEKAGIFKAHVPVVSARQHAEAAAVVRHRALELVAPFFCADENYSWQATDVGFDYHGLETSLQGLVPGLAGTHQLENLSLALAAAEQLRRAGVTIPDEALRQGVSSVRWPGRLEWLGDRVLLDGAHNQAGAEALATYLAGEDLEKIHWVAGLKADKESDKILSCLLPRVGQLYACRPPVEEAIPPEKLAEQARSADVPASLFDTPEQAFAAALKSRAPGEVILVAGSLFLVAAVREQLLDENSELTLPDTNCSAGS